MQQVNCNNFFLNAAKIWAQNEKVVKLHICEIIYKRNFENNFIVFLIYVLWNPILKMIILCILLSRILLSLHIKF